MIKMKEIKLVLTLVSKGILGHPLRSKPFSHILTLFLQWPTSACTFIGKLCFNVDSTFTPSFSLSLDPLCVCLVCVAVLEKRGTGAQEFLDCANLNNLSQPHKVRRTKKGPDNPHWPSSPPYSVGSVLLHLLRYYLPRHRAKRSKS